MKEQLVTYETAKLAMENGFPQKDGVDYYLENGNLSTAPFTDYINGKTIATAPTQSLLQKWLREEHNTQICVRSDFTYETMRYDCIYENLNSDTFHTELF
ncbi:MAG TPA: hypothetical protein VLA13_05095, partial [Massilibacterium sp.]|nr:hypothetical protein [Massilibacterium sp.]